MIERIAGLFAVATAGLGLWMAFRHVWGVRPPRVAAALHLLGGALLLELALLATRMPSPLTAGMIAAALASGMAIPLTAKSVPEGAGMVILGHGAVALAAVALVAVWAMG